MSSYRFPFVVAAVTAVLGASVLAKTTFKSVWKSPTAHTVSFAGAKVAALVMDKDDSLRVAGEEAMVAELNARGMQGVASYRIGPKEELQDAQKARGWYDRSGVTGVVVLRVVSDDKIKSYTPATWSSAYYTSLWGYYGYGWGAVYSPASTRSLRFISLETLIYSVATDGLVWAGLSETENPKTLAQVIEEVAKEAVKEMQKQGLAKQQKK
jgi:hypothetical protein